MATYYKGDGTQITIPASSSVDTAQLVDNAVTYNKLSEDVQDLLDSTEPSGDGLTEAIKQALLQLADKVAYIDNDGQDYYDALYDALYPPAELSSISCVYTQSGTVYDTDSLDSLKSDLVVTAHWSDNTTSTVASTDYTLSGTLTTGTSTITVSYGGKTTTFNVTVTHYTIPSEVLTSTSSTRINSTTFENESASNYWVFGASTMTANKITFSWNTEECNQMQIAIAQYDANGDPYKISQTNASISDGDDIVFGDPGSVWYTTLTGGSIEVPLPTTGVVKVVTRRGSGTGSVVTSNSTYGTWLSGGGLTVTAYRV